MRFALITLAATWLAGTSAQPDEPRLPVKVLYAGKGGSERSRDFLDFLKESVAEVGSAEFATFRDRDADGYDLVILDGDPGDVDRSFTKDDGPALGWPTLSPTYARPTVLIGAMGGLVAKRQQLKMSWLCSCLDNLAHVLSPSHEIFRGPVVTDRTIESFPTPPRYRDWPGGATLSASIPSWTVQRSTWMAREGQKQQPIVPSMNPGLVLDPYGFDDSPDCESIAAGLNWKCWNALAIARQANFLFWGFSYPPSDMTPAGLAGFLNGLAYIRKFDGQRPLAPRTHSHRTMWLKYASIHDFIDDEPTYATMMPDHLRRRLGSDYDGYPAYYRDNLEFLHPTGTSYVVDVDEDAKALGLSNRRVDSLEAWVKRLETNDPPDQAGRLLKRYTLESFEHARDWRTWLDRHRGQLYFSDTSGYKFRVAPEGLPIPVKAEVTPQDPDTRHPVAAEIALTPDRLRVGETFTLTVRVRLAPTWHLYAVEGERGPGSPTTLTLDCPAGVEPDGPWELPASEVRNGLATYAGTFTFRRRLRIRPEASLSSVTIGCKLRFQACDPIRCLPPTTWTLSTGAAVTP